MNRIKIALVFSLLLLILVFRFFFFYHNQPKYHDKQHLSFETTLLSEPQIIGNKQKIFTSLERGGRIFIITSLYPKFYYGDTLRISGTLKYKSLGNKSTIMTMWYPKIEIVEDDPSTPLRVFLAIPSFIRQKSISLFEKTLPPTSSALLLGIVFGVKESLPIHFSDSLRISGVFHVVAASGMNVTMAGGFLSSVFSWFLKRQIAILLSVVGICLYAVIAGLDPPIVRASIMGILVFTARILGRQSLSLYGLFLSGFAMLFSSPSLIFDVGFQLSFLATLGLLYIQPILEGGRNVKKLINNSILGEGVVTTVAAQVATLPILLSNFGMYSLWSIVANGLVLFSLPTLMVIGGLGAISGIILPLFGQLILYIALPFLLYFEKIIMFFGELVGVIEVKDLPWQFVVGYYSLLTGLILFFSRKNNL